MFQDDLFVIHVTDDFASLLESVFKTEFLTILAKRFKDRTQKTLRLDFKNTLEFAVKKEGWGGGGMRCLKFQQGQSDLMQIKGSGKAATVSIGPGLPKNSRPGKFDMPRGGGQQFVTNNNNRNKHTKAPARAAPAPPTTQPPQSGRRIGSPRARGQDRTPSLPREGAQQRARRPSHENSNLHNQSWMKTPDAGMAGLTRRSTLEKNRPAPGGGRPKPKKELPPKPNRPRGRCLYAYDAQDTDELSFNEGDVIEVLKEDPAGWWLGQLTGQKGLFPCNYIEKE